MKDGGQAYPSTATWNPNSGEMHEREESGMSLRDRFAIAAMPAILQTWHSEDDKPGLSTFIVDRDSVADSVASDCYCMADAMLAAREQAEG